MMKSLLSLSVIFSAMFLTACDQDTDLRKYVDEVKAQPPMPIEPLPTLTPYSPAKFTAATERDPFTDPKPEQGQIVGQIKEKCVQPDQARPKEDLEQFSLDNLAMKGTLANTNGLWALIQSPNGTIYRVAKGQHMGLNYGKVTSVSKTEIQIEEMVSDNAGCWDHRVTVLSLNNSVANTHKKQG